LAEQFYTILTAVGKAKIANAAALGEKVNFTELALGDSNGSYYNPSEDQAALRNEVWRENIGNIAVDEENPNWIVAQTIIPGQVGGFMIREAGIFDDNGDLIAVGKYPETYKPTASAGSVKDLVIKMILEVSNTASVVLKVDPTVILATQKQVDEAKAAAKAYADTKVGDLSTLTTAEKDNLVGAVNEMAGAVNEINSEVLALQTGATPAADANKLGGQEPEYYASADQIDAHEADKAQHMAYATASGTDSYTVSIPGILTLTEGLSVKIKFPNANTGAATLNINGLGAKVIQKSNGSALSAGNIKAGQIMHLVYGGSVFQLLGEGGEYGTAGAAQILTGYTVGTESGLLDGTMPNRGAVSQSLAVNGSYIIPQGYHNGAGQVTQSIATKGAATITPSTVNQVIAANQYLSGAQTIAGSANLLAANIKEGINIFGVVGTLAIGKRWASGTAVRSGSLYTFQVSGLAFTPRIVITKLSNASDDQTGISIYVDSAIFGTSYGINVWTYNGTNAETADAQISAGGFTIKAGTKSASSLTCNWVAFE
jgi:phage-related tail fiber protein